MMAVAKSSAVPGDDGFETKKAPPQRCLFVLLSAPDQ
jgi:hypothetical protein